MGDAHRGVGLVDVLAAGAGGAVGVGAHVGGVDLDLDGVVHLGEHEHRAEAGVTAGVGVEGALADEAVDAGLGAQEAVGVFAGELDRAVLDAGDLALGLFHQLDGEALFFAVAQVHALEHARPVLRLGAAGAGLDLDEAVVGVHRVAEHAAELERLDRALQLDQVGLDRLEGVVVVLGLGEFEEILEVARLRVDLLQRQHHVLELTLLLAELLRALGVVPDGWVLERAVDLFELRCFHIVVKDTSVVRDRGRRGRRVFRRWRSGVRLPCAGSGSIWETADYSGSPPAAAVGLVALEAWPAIGALGGEVP